MEAPLNSGEIQSVTQLICGLEDGPDGMSLCNSKVKWSIRVRKVFTCRDMHCAHLKHFVDPLVILISNHNSDKHCDSNAQC